MARFLAWAGGIGAAIGIACCITSLLPATLMLVGLASYTDMLYRDAVLLPFAAVSIGLFGVGLFMMRKAA